MWPEKWSSINVLSQIWIEQTSTKPEKTKHRIHYSCSIKLQKIRNDFIMFESEINHLRPVKVFWNYSKSMYPSPFLSDSLMIFLIYSSGILAFISRFRFNTYFNYSAETLPSWSLSSMLNALSIFSCLKTFRFSKQLLTNSV